MPQEVAERSGFSFDAILRAIRGGELHAVEPVCDRDQLADSYSHCLGTQIPVRHGGPGRDVPFHRKRRPT
jgi:hypothetical protein